MPNESDELMPTRWTLICRLKSWDDHESWREFFDLYWKLIYGAAIKSGLTPDEAQEVVQETIISVCRNIKDFKTVTPRGSFKSWLLKLTRWRILDQVRRRRPREDSVRVRPGRQDTATSIVAQIPDPAADLDRIWDNEWERNLLAAALEKLERQVSARHYQVYYLHVIKQYPVEKVARVAGIKPDQVYLIKHRLGLLFKEAISKLEAKMN
jgi:RNA polymerase sigma factor (sigma-70 family)